VLQLLDVCKLVICHCSSVRFFLLSGGRTLLSNLICEMLLYSIVDDTRTSDLVRASNGEYIINAQTRKPGQLLWHKSGQFMSLEKAASVPFGPPDLYPNPHP
jgi:hypothetical protein